MILIETFETELCEIQFLFFDKYKCRSEFFFFEAKCRSELNVK